MDHCKSHGSWDIFIHNAGLTVSTSQDEYFEVNALLTEKLIATLKECKSLSRFGKFIYLSSFAAHGPSNQSGPVSAYGSSKAAAEKYVINSGLNYQICRPTGIYGSGDMAFLPLFKSAAFGIYPMMAPKAQLMTLIHGADLAKGIVRHFQNDEKILHFDDGHVYTHDDFRKALSHAATKKLRNIRLPIQIVKGWLKISDYMSHLLGSRPGVTLEKYNEISQNWDLRNNTDLYHPEISCEYDLMKGCKETFDYYKKHNLV